MRFRGVIMYERVAMGWNGQVGRGKGKGKGKGGKAGRAPGKELFASIVHTLFLLVEIGFCSAIVQSVATARPDKRGRHVGRGRADGSSRDDGWRCVLADWGLR